MVIRVLAEGAASGLNVIAVYVTEILRVTGFDGGCTDGPYLHVLPSHAVSAQALLHATLCGSGVWNFLPVVYLSKRIRDNESSK